MSSLHVASGTAQVITAAYRPRTRWCAARAPRKSVPQSERRTRDPRVPRFPPERISRAFGNRTRQRDRSFRQSAYLRTP